MKKYLILFQDVKFNIYIFCALAAASILGTLIPQSAEAPEKVQEFIVRRPAIGAVFENLGFFNLYHSWWFMALLGLMAFDVVICKILFGKFPGVKNFKDGELNDAYLRSRPYHSEFVSQKNAQELSGKISNVLQSKGFAVQLRPGESGSVYVLAARQRLQRFGSWVSHIAILLILFANFLGAGWGFRENLNIPEGSSVKMDRRPWTVACEKFIVELYEGGQTPKTFASEIKIFNEEKVLSEASILVNEPLEFERVRFYQATYSPMLKGVRLGFFKRDSPEKSSPPLDLALDEEAPIPGTPYTVKILEYVPDFYLDEAGKVASRSPNPMNPALKIQVSEKGRPVKSPWIFQKYPALQMPPMQAMEDYIPVLGAMDTKYITGIQVAYDPGAGVFWMGCTVLVASLMILFYLHHRKLWILVRKNPAGKGSIVILGGFSSRGKSYEAGFLDVLERLKAVS